MSPAHPCPGPAEAEGGGGQLAVGRLVGGIDGKPGPLGAVRAPPD